MNQKTMSITRMYNVKRKIFTLIELLVNLPIGACYPVKLTTLHYDRKDIARNVLAILQDKISGKSSPVRMNIPVKLIVRESTDKNSGKEGA